jgi:homoserine kinase type II
MHLAGGSLDGPAGRFESAALRARLTRIAEEAPGHYPVERLRRALDESDRARDPTLPAGLVHGDLFRDNVLWNGASLAALLDFESAHRGALAYDLAVCTLAWCYGDAFDDRLSRALVAGYETVRPLSEAEHRALPAEMRFAAVRFAITRITDYAMRPPEGRVMKDWKRFLARLDALTG